MKFLCVPCDRPMTLRTVAPPDRGSLSVVYSCPDCGYEIAMLTNPYETQLVQSLGVRVGPDETAAGMNGKQSREAADAGASSGKCPFAGMVSSAASTVSEPPRDAASRPDADVIRWTASAEARLANIPSFVRPMARTGIEKFAREKGCLVIDEQILDEARDFFGM